MIHIYGRSPEHARIYNPLRLGVGYDSTMNAELTGHNNAFGCKHALDITNPIAVQGSRGIRQLLFPTIEGSLICLMLKVVIFYYNRRVNVTMAVLPLLLIRVWNV